MKILYIGIVTIIFSYLGLCMLIFLTQGKLMFFPSKESSILPNIINLQEIYIKTEDGVRLNAWFLDNKSDKTVIFFHGNGGNIFYNQERLKIFNELHLNALIPDYRGYGRSEGSIQKEEDLYKDADALYNYVLGKGVSPKNIIFWGQSLGGSIAIHLAQDKDIYATIVESTFFSMDEMARKEYWFLPTKFLLKFHFKNNEKISNIHSPILIIHSKDDEMINFSNGERLFEKIKTAKLFLETTGTHNGGFEKSYTSYVSTLENFLTLDK